MTRGYLSDREVQQVRLVDIAAELVRESAAAWLINDGAVETWVPKSQAEHNRDGTFTMPEWLAAERGLV